MLRLNFSATKMSKVPCLFFILCQDYCNIELVYGRRETDCIKTNVFVYTGTYRNIIKPIKYKKDRKERQRSRDVFELDVADATEM